MLRIGYAFGAVALGPIAGLATFVLALVKKGRAFHPHGTPCRAVIEPIDDHPVGKRLAGAARVRLSSVSHAENSLERGVFGMAIELAEPAQDLPLATFEAFTKLSEANASTEPTDYLVNTYASVTPWRVDGLGVVWFRAVPRPATRAPTGTRTERLDAAIAAGGDAATFVLEARSAPYADGPVIARVATIRIVGRDPDDDPGFRIRVTRTGRGVHPTGVRNGIRVVAYPCSQLGRRLRGA